MKIKSYLLSSGIADRRLRRGCAVGPNYHEAEAVSAPAHWGEPLAGGETNGPAAVAAWWKNFHDPELDSLI